MDFNRAQPRPVVSSNTNVGETAMRPNKRQEHTQRFSRGNKWFNISAIVLLFLIAVLVTALAGAFAWGNNGQQSKYINKNEYQAVFVNVNGTTGGQVYFGHIKDVNSQYIDLTNVFYIQNQSSGSTSSSSSSYTLVKLGCELHGPEDQMIINTNQVYFWENLKPSGQVTQKINQYYQQNPTGQNCSQSSSSGSTTQSSSTTQSPASTTTPATSSSTATTPKKP